MFKNGSLALGHLLVFITILIWSVAFVGNKVLLFYITPIEVMLYRFILAYVVLLLIYPSLNTIKSLKDEIYFFMIGFLGIFLYFLLENYALKYTQATNVGLYMGAIPLFTAIIAHFILQDEKLSKNIIIGFTLAMVGMALILLDGKGFSLRLKGDMIAILAAFTFALYSTILKLAPKGYHFIVVTRKSFLYAIVLMILYHFISHQPLHLQALLLPKVYGNIIFLGLFASSLAFLFYKKGVEIIGSVKSTNYIYLVPLLTAITGIIVLDEQLTIKMIIGGILILIGLYIAQKKPKVVN